MKVGILWDLDGTLLDTLEDLADSVNHALEQFGYPRRSLEEIRRFVGNGARRLIALAVPEGEDPETAGSRPDLTMEFWRRWIFWDGSTPWRWCPTNRILL